ncbi:MAG: hypothetical protein ACK4YP_25915 [Myxococcota bacterium]
MLSVLLLACAPPFDETRKDLAGFRLVGTAVRDGRLHADVWSGEGAFHATAPTVTWTIDGNVATDAPPAPFTARVRVENADGLSEEGELTVDADATTPTIASFTRTTTDTGATFALDVTSDATTRWMASSGTFTETGPNSADWAAEDAPLTTVYALTLDGRGGNVGAWIDVATDTGPYLAVAGRLLPVEAPVTEGDWLATITPADTHAGLVLTDLVPATDTAESVCGLDPVDSADLVAALVDGRCGLDEAAGARVRLAGAPWP